MNFLGFSIVFILVGIPAIIGAHNIAAHVGKDSIRDGVGVLIYAAAVAAGFAILLPEGAMVSANFLIKSPGVFVICTLIGLGTGTLARLSKK